MLGAGIELESDRTAEQCTRRGVERCNQQRMQDRLILAMTVKSHDGCLSSSHPDVAAQASRLQGMAKTAMPAAITGIPSTIPIGLV